MNPTRGLGSGKWFAFHVREVRGLAALRSAEGKDFCLPLPLARRRCRRSFRALANVGLQRTFRDQV